MSLFSSVPFENKTVYRIEYQPKHVERLDKRKNCGISHVFPDKADYEYSDEVLQKLECFRQKIAEQNLHVKSKKYEALSQPLNLEIVKKTLKDLEKTTYDADYNRSEDRKDKGGKETYELPPGWVIPITTQQVSYRPPAIWGDNIPPSEPILPSSNLMPNLKEREILKVTTGESDYMAEIGATAEKILKKNKEKKMKKLLTDIIPN